MPLNDDLLRRRLSEAFFSGRLVVFSRTRAAAQPREGIEWALVRVSADEDDDPEWVRARLEEEGAPPPKWTQVEICPSLEDGWRVIRDSNESELDARDLDALAAEFPLLFSLPLFLEDVGEVQRGLRHARGFSFALADERGAAPGAHRFNLEQVRAILERLDAD
jgi:hypothetical protein